MTTVYVVTSGSYSDYSINGIFSTREKAEAFMAAFPDRDSNGIDEWTLDKHVTEVEAGLTCFQVIMRRDGSVPADGARPRSHPPDEVTTEVSWRDGYDRETNGTMQYAYFALWAKDAAHAIKIANERRIAALAGEMK